MPSESNNSTAKSSQLDPIKWSLAEEQKLYILADPARDLAWAEIVRHFTTPERTCEAVKYHYRKARLAELEGADKTVVQGWESFYNNLLKDNAKDTSLSVKNLKEGLHRAGTTSHECRLKLFVLGFFGKTVKSEAVDNTFAPEGQNAIAQSLPTPPLASNPLWTIEKDKQLYTGNDFGLAEATQRMANPTSNRSSLDQLRVSRDQHGLASGSNRTAAVTSPYAYQPVGPYAWPPKRTSSDRTNPARERLELDPDRSGVSWFLSKEEWTEQLRRNSPVRSDFGDRFEHPYVIDDEAHDMTNLHAQDFGPVVRHTAQNRQYGQGEQGMRIWSPEVREEGPYARPSRKRMGKQRSDDDYLPGPSRKVQK